MITALEISSRLKTVLSGCVAWIESPCAGSEAKLSPRVVWGLISIRFQPGRTKNHKSIWAPSVGLDTWRFGAEIHASTLEQALMIRAALITEFLALSGQDGVVGDSEISLPSGTARGVTIALDLSVSTASRSVKIDELRSFVPGANPNLDFDDVPGVRTVFELDGSDVSAPNGAMSPVNSFTYSPDDEVGGPSCGTT